MSQELFNWVWLVFFIIIVVVRKIYERKAGKHITLKGTPIAEAILMVLWGVAASAFPLFYIFTTWLNFANLPFEMPLTFSFFGTLLFLVSIWLLYRSHVDLGKLWSPTVEPEPKQKLVTDGIYKRIRHPMYTAHVLWGISQTLLIPNLIAGPLALVLIFALIGLRVPREEQAMIQEFGDEYCNYMNTTGCIFPKLTT